MAQFFCLHHGSNVVVDAPEWNRGSRYRDFGQCFYTTYSEQMAKDWALSTVLASQTYANLVNNNVLINEGDLFVYEQLENELMTAGIL